MKILSNALVAAAEFTTMGTVHNATRGNNSPHLTGKQCSEAPSKHNTNPGKSNVFPKYKSKFEQQVH